MRRAAPSPPRGGGGRAWGNMARLHGDQAFPEIRALLVRSYLMADTMVFLRLAAREAGAGVLRFRDRSCDPFAEAERVSVAEAFAEHAGVDLMVSIRGDGSTDAAALGAELDRIGVRRAEDDTCSDMLSRVLSE